MSVESGGTEFGRYNDKWNVIETQGVEMADSG